MTVDYEAYSTEKDEFLRTLGTWQVETSQLDEYGRYHKEYIGEKGTWYEVMSPVEEEVTAQTVVHGETVRLKQNVKFLRTEFWSSKNPESKFYYELF